MQFTASVDGSRAENRIARSSDAASCYRLGPLAGANANLTVIVPLHDEAPGVVALAAGLRELVAASAECRVDLVLVDDGSTDDTHPLLVEHFEGMPCQILRHPTNEGLSAALSTGLGAARGELVGWLDSDLTYAPAVLLELAAAVLHYFSLQKAYKNSKNHLI